ncbi:MAG: TlpA family protein disulfide reductase [Chloroflexi bacterium]|nr:MAG: TlpA family protein disulfide reductase [Chloroflexota bacterium]
MVAAWEDYRDKGVVFIGVAYLEDSEASALAFIEEFGAHYINGFDYGTRIGRTYNVQGVPETFIIDQNGEIQYFYMQPLSYQNLSRVLDDLLAKGETAS